MEITGTLEVFDLDDQTVNLGQILPNLAVVRGYPHHQYPGLNASVVIAGNEYLKSISLKAGSQYLLHLPRATSKVPPCRLDIGLSSI